MTIRVVPERSEQRTRRRSAARLVSVELGGSISYNVLADWLDPDGDDVYLDAASATSADQVRFTPDGFITFANTSGQPGTKEVSFTVSDGRLTATGHARGEGGRPRARSARSARPTSRRPSPARRWRSIRSPTTSATTDNR